MLNQWHHCTNGHHIGNISSRWSSISADARIYFDAIHRLRGNHKSEQFSFLRSLKLRFNDFNRSHHSMRTSPVCVIFLQKVDFNSSSKGWLFKSQSTVASVDELSKGSPHLGSCKLLQSKQFKALTSANTKYKTKRFTIKPFIANVCSKTVVN